MKIKLTKVYVDDQEKALRFYAEVMGFVKKADFSNGPFRWLTVASPEEPDGSELLLESIDFAPARPFRQALRDAGIPFTQFAVEDIQAACDRLTKLGVVFPQKPTQMGPTTIAMFDDTCGNFIQLIQN